LVVTSVCSKWGSRKSGSSCILLCYWF